MRHVKIDLFERAKSEGIDLQSALDDLFELYAEVDRRNEANTKDLDLPCKSGCSDCCEESVFMTPLEFYGAWNHLQNTCDDETFCKIVDEGLAIYEEKRALIEAFERPPPEGESDHVSIHMQLQFRCPLLSDAGSCRVYEAREMLGRLFGCSFNSQGGVYGCHLVGAHLADQEVTLIRARPMANRVHSLPLTHKQQVYPFYIHMLYGKRRAKLPIAIG